MTVATPGKDTTLSEHTSIQVLPAYAIMLDDGLIRNTEGSASEEAPVGRVESDRGLLETFTCAAEGKEACRIEIREHEDKNVQWKICDGCGSLSHGGESLGVWSQK